MALSSLSSMIPFPAHGFCYVGGDEVYAALGGNVAPENYNNTQLDKPPEHSVTNGRVNLTRPEKDFTGTVPPDLRVVGLWVGNLSYRVGESQKNLYLIDPRGHISPMAKGTNSDDVCVPPDNAFVKNIMRMQPSPSQESQLRVDQSKNGGSGRYIGGGAGLLIPTVVATRTMIMNGHPMIVGGPVICELPRACATVAPQAMPQATRTQACVVKKKRACHKQAEIMK
jgi:hypothetical protein